MKNSVRPRLLQANSLGVCSNVLNLCLILAIADDSVARKIPSDEHKSQLLVRAYSPIFSLDTHASQLVSFEFSSSSDLLSYT